MVAVAGAALVAVYATTAAAQNAISDVRAQSARSPLDFEPLWGAAVALAHGHPVYGAIRFVYPPTAAVLLLPLTALHRGTAAEVWLALSAIAVAVATFAGASRGARGVPRLLVGLVAGAVVVRGDIVYDSLRLGNLSLLLAPVAVAILILFERGNWRSANGLLFLSLLVKPLLAPLVVVPLLMRKWRATAEAAAAGCLLLLLGVVLIPGGSGFFSVLGYVARGSELRGANAAFNISIAGLADRWNEPSVGWAARGAVGVLGLGLLWWWRARGSQRQGDLALLGSWALLIVFLGSSLAERHYLLVALPCVLAGAAYRGWRSLLYVLPAFVVLTYERYYLGGHASPSTLQLRYFLAEMLLTGVTGLLILHRPETLVLPGSLDAPPVPAVD